MQTEKYSRKHAITLIKEIIEDADGHDIIFETMIEISGKANLEKSMISVVDELEFSKKYKLNKEVV